MDGFTTSRHNEGLEPETITKIVRPGDLSAAEVAALVDRGRALRNAYIATTMRAALRNGLRTLASVFRPRPRLQRSHQL